jgi:hypothetical protein
MDNITDEKLIDRYLSLVLEIPTIIFLILSIIFLIVLIISFCYHLCKKNTHFKIVVFCLIFSTLINILFQILLIVQVSCIYFRALPENILSLISFVVITVGCTCEVGLGFLFCYLSFIYLKTLKDLGLVKRWLYIILNLILIFLFLIVVFCLFLIYVGLIITIILMLAINNVQFKIFYYVFLMPSIFSMISLIGICCILITVYSIRLIFYIFYVAKNIKDKKSKLRNLFTLLKILFLVLSLNLVYSLHFEVLGIELIYVIIGKYLWVVAYFFYMLSTFLVSVLIFISFLPSLNFFLI